MERVVAHWEAIRDQDRPDLAARRRERRGVRVKSRYDGMTVIEIVVPSEDADRFINTLDAYVDRHRSVQLNAPPRRPRPIRWPGAPRPSAAPTRWST